MDPGLEMVDGEDAGVNKCMLTGVVEALFHGIKGRHVVRKLKTEIEDGSKWEVMKPSLLLLVHILIVVWVVSLVDTDGNGIGGFEVSS